MQTASAAVPQRRSFNTVRLYLFMLVIVVVADLIGATTLKIGSISLVMLPMIWAIIIGGAFGAARSVLPAPLKLDLPLQFKAAGALQVGLLLFTAKTGLLVGGSLPVLFNSGWSLLFQELGHFAGTMILALPLALLLGIKKEAIGATFSIGREPALAIIGERRGMNSPEGRGVLAEYLTGTLFGAIFITVLASFIASLHIFDAKALAMGAGVGSGTVMAAAAAAISAAHPPEMSKTILAFAAASNLLTSVVGTYFTLFISLPVATWLYRVLEPRIGRFSKRRASLQPLVPVEDVESAQSLTAGERLIAWAVIALIALLGSTILNHNEFWAPFPGMVIMLGCVIAGHTLARALKGKVPAVGIVSLVAMYFSSPLFPWAATVVSFANKVDFLAMATPLLTLAGLALAKDLPAFRQLGWRIVLVSFVANAGTFLGATVIAQLFI